MPLQNVLDRLGQRSLIIQSLNASHHSQINSTTLLARGKIESSCQVGRKATLVKVSLVASKIAAKSMINRIDITP
jgi:hypothetical protein